MINYILYATLEIVLCICFFALGLFDYERGSGIINIMEVAHNKSIGLCLIGVFWAIIGLVEVYLSLSLSNSKYTNTYRRLITASVPLCIVYKSIFLTNYPYSADYLIFVLIPIVEIGILIFNNRKECKNVY